jgi:hypothetical protein
MTDRRAAVLPGQDTRRDAFWKLALAIGVMVVVLEVGYLIYSPYPYDPIGYLIGRDFVNTWLGGRLALGGNPAPYFGFEAYRQLLFDNFGPNYPTHIWSYPPHLLLFTWPLALLPYMPAYVVFSAAGLLLYLAVASEGSRRWDHLLLLLLAPAVTINIWCGQFGFLVAALLIGGLLQIDRRPILAGVLFGLLSFKPQLGLLLPVMLLLTGRWRTIFAAAATIGVLAVATSVVFGVGVWTAYVEDAMPIQTKVVVDGISHYMVHMPTAFMNAKVAGLPLSACILIQAVVSVTTLAAVVWTFWRRRDPVLSNALFVTAIFAFTPYAFNYDMVVFGWVILKLVDRGDNTAWDYGLMLGIWAVPFFTVPMGMSTVMPFSSFLVLAFGARLLWRLWKAEPVTAPADAGTGALTLADSRVGVSSR